MLKKRLFLSRDLYYNPIIRDTYIVTIIEVFFIVRGADLLLSVGVANLVVHVVFKRGERGHKFFKY